MRVTLHSSRYTTIYLTLTLLAIPLWEKDGTSWNRRARESGAATKKTYIYKSSCKMLGKWKVPGNAPQPPLQTKKHYHQELPCFILALECGWIELPAREALRPPIIPELAQPPECLHLRRCRPSFFSLFCLDSFLCKWRPVQVLMG